MPANLYRRGRTWWFRATVAGREHRSSLRTADRKVAERRAAIELERLQGARFGDVRRSWKEAVLLWHERATAERLAPATIRRYLSSLAVCDALLGSLHLDEIRIATLRHLARRSGASNATRRRDLTAVSAVLRAAVHEGWIDANVARSFDRTAIRERRDPIVLPPDHEVGELVTALGGTLGPMVRVLELTGLRLDEAGGLRWQDVDLARAAITLTRTKGRRPRTVPLTAQAVGTLRALPRKLGSPWVFWRPDGARYAGRSLPGAIGKVRKRLGLTWRTHDLRHLFAVRYLREGGSIYVLQQILGHSTIAVTELYLAYLTPDEAERAKAAAG